MRVDREVVERTLSMCCLKNRGIVTPSATLWGVWAMCRLWLRIINGLICLVVMWTFLGLFTTYRHDIVTKAGSANEDN